MISHVIEHQQAAVPVCLQPVPDQQTRITGDLSGAALRQPGPAGTGLALRSAW